MTQELFEFAGKNEREKKMTKGMDTTGKEGWETRSLIYRYLDELIENPLEDIQDVQHRKDDQCRSKEEKFIQGDDLCRLIL